MRNNGQSAAKPRTEEGSETIRNGVGRSVDARSGGHPYTGEDIVQSISKEMGCCKQMEGSWGNLQI